MKLEGRKIIFHHPDIGFTREIISKGCYTSMAGFDIASDDVVVDLGANVGVFSILAGIRAHDGHVVAIEPEDQNYRFLCDNVNGQSFLE